MLRYRERMPRQEHLGASHVFDLGHLLDINHHSYIGNDVGLALVQEAHSLQRTIGLFLPHPQTSLIVRVEKPESGWSVYVIYAQELDDLIQMNLFVHYSQPTKKWAWVGTSVIDRHAPHVPPTPPNEQPQFRATIVIDTDLVPNQRHEDVIVGNPLKAIMLLLQKSDTIIVEPAPWWSVDEPAKPKAFETANPSVSIVRVNTPRIIVRPPRSDDGSGAKVRPHDRRAHLVRRGRKIIWRKESKVNGGAEAAVAKVVKIDKDLSP
jgi:hypothetical protein